jgi:MoxR-like ATPase
MRQLQVSQRGRRGFAPLQRGVKPTDQQMVLDRVQPLRTFRVPGAHLVAPAIGVGEITGGLAHQTNSSKVRGMLADTHIRQLLNQLNTVIVGKEAQVRDCVACLLAGGHLLIEDVPGVGKTTLAHALSRSFGLEFARVQFTADLMPSDLVGVSVYERGREGFVFHPGPVFAQVLLADEINRASPKTQSALLEAMEEKQVTVEGETRALPEPFFVIATQNPHDQLGTYALPESQLDRFHMRISLGYPDRAAERELLRGEDRRHMVDQLVPVLSPESLALLQQQVATVHTAEPVLDYLQDLVAATRSGRWFAQGLSPRAALAVVRAAKAQAFLSGRDYVAPDDIAAILPQTTAHRLIPVADAGRGAVEQVRAMLEAVALP